jgi:hypothetical protein
MKPKAKKTESTLSSTKKAIKQKIITLKTTKEINSSIRLFAQNTQKLNQQPKMVTWTKRLASNLDNSEEENFSLFKKEIIHKTPPSKRTKI